MSRTVAEALRARDHDAIERVSEGFVRLSPTNFVERPWGGLKIRAYKGVHPLPDQAAITGKGLGEAFEVAAFRADSEARDHPSLVLLDDGSTMGLPELLDVAGPRILGNDVHRRHGPEIPLLPKTLDVRELLSVQAHPPGNTEAYIILDAEPGATLRLGFRRSVDAGALVRNLEAGRQLQESFLRLLHDDADQIEVNRALGKKLAQRAASAEEIAVALEPYRARAASRDELSRGVGRLKELYWYALDLLNEVPVRAGQVLHNATPKRLVERSGRHASAEVHALGNPEGREILALEIRRPGITYRAWDHVRFPLRELDIRAAVRALSHEATSPEDFEAEIVPVAGSPGVFRSIASEAFVVDHLRPRPGDPLWIRGGSVQTLHGVSGTVTLEAGRTRVSLARGCSAIASAALDGYVASATDDEDAEVIRVTLPPITAR